jgi:hypothetical protein
MEFYVYKNSAGGATIHVGACPECADGTWQPPAGAPLKHAWGGPYETLEQACRAAIEGGAQASVHSCISKLSPEFDFLIKPRTF